MKYDRSPVPAPIPGHGPGGPPDGLIEIADVLAALARAFLVDRTG